MDYKKKYKEALEKARQLCAYPTTKPFISDLQDLFPELKVSEDEEMWKLIKKYAHYNISDTVLEADHITREYLESWLEKKSQAKEIVVSQHENKTYNENDGSLSGKDENLKNAIIRFFEDRYPKAMEIYNGNFTATIGEVLTWLEKQDFNYTFEIKEGYWYKCVCDYMLNNSDVMFKYDRLYYCRRNWRLDGEIDEINVKDIGVNGYKSFFRPATNQEIKDWLEKKSEQKPYSQMEKCINCQFVFTGYCNGTCILENKVEPKFKVGDWIIFNGLTLYIKEVVQGYYRTITIDNIPNSYDWDIDNAARLWTIKEVKNGDVLKEDSCVFIVERINPNGTARVHCCLFDDGEFDLTGSTLGFDIDSTHPATKEQRNLLFQKIKEAGYTWNIDKKELIKL